MKKTLLMIITFLLTVNLFSQEVEKVGEIEEIKHRMELTRETPFGIYVNEVEEKMEIMNGNWDGSTELLINNINQKKEKDDIKSFWADGNIRLHENIIGFSNSLITLQKNKNIYAKVGDIASGISFILKKDSGYIVYYVNESGTPGAVDTEGRIYSNTEALAYLKEYDPEKYAESLSRAEELGLKSDFERAGVLIWGQTLYASDGSVKQYDIQGYSYKLINLGFRIRFICENSNNEIVFKIMDIYDHSKILTEEEGSYSLSWYVGYGGNIYYYIAGEEYTEVFRIRRTWGKADMYAMAINGYTEDSYGEYVKTTLAGMSKAELRLLRNTIFALYGVHFKSEDLSKHFAKEVWYTDEGKTSGDVNLPEHRQKLVEMIQAMERK